MKRAKHETAFYGHEVFNRLNFSGRMNATTDEEYSATLLRWVWCQWCEKPRALRVEFPGQFNDAPWNQAHSCHVCQDSGAVARAMRIA
jgi:hypothetical protein